VDVHDRCKSADAARTIQPRDQRRAVDAAIFEILHDDLVLLADQDRSWWAFRAPVRRPLPAVTDARWNVNPIDAFLKQALDAKGLEVAPPADRRTLLRRAYLDMIGLLPSPNEVEAFIYDPAPDAWEKVVDRLLASPIMASVGPALAGRGTLCRQLGPHPR
jgi:hypothetical protein